MNGYRNTDLDVPFFWESDAQPPGRWHAVGAGPAQYLATSPEAAWAEHLRHEEITDPADLAGVRRAMWTVELPDEEPLATPRLRREAMVGGFATYPRCQRESARLRDRHGVAAPSLTACAPLRWPTLDRRHARGIFPRNGSRTEPSRGVAT